MHILKLFLLILPPFLVMDLLWLGVVMKTSTLMSSATSPADRGPRWPPDAPQYSFICSFLPGSCSSRGRSREQVATVSRSFGSGALFGLVLYGVYDLTNLAVLEKWTLRVTLADIAWGCVLCGTTAVLMRFVDGLLAGPSTMS